MPDSVIPDSVVPDSTFACYAQFRCARFPQTVIIPKATLREEGGSERKRRVRKDWGFGDYRRPASFVPGENRWSRSAEGEEGREGEATQD